VREPLVDVGMILEKTNGTNLNTRNENMEHYSED